MVAVRIPLLRPRPLYKPFSRLALYPPTEKRESCIEVLKWLAVPWITIICCPALSSLIISLKRQLPRCFFELYALDFTPVSEFHMLAIPPPKFHSPITSHIRKIPLSHYPRRCADTSCYCTAKLRKKESQNIEHFFLFRAKRFQVRALVHDHGKKLLFSMLDVSRGKVALMHRLIQ